MQKTVNSRNHDLVLFNSSVGPLSGATILSQNGPVSDCRKGVLRIPPKLQNTRWGESYSSAEKQPVYSTAPADWAIDKSW